MISKVTGKRESVIDKWSLTERYLDKVE